MSKAGGSPVSQFSPQSKTSVGGIWFEDWRLFYLRLFFMKYVRIGKGEGKMWGGTTETLLTNQKAEVKVLFLSHLGYSELGDSSSSLQRETIFQNLQCVIFFSVYAPVSVKKKKKMCLWICACVQALVFPLRTYHVILHRFLHCMTKKIPNAPTISTH